MAENTPNVPGAPVPPRPSDAKVQPKKETVRINLPPKPTASATIKLPTLPAAAPPPPPAAAAAPKPPGAVPPSAIAPPPGVAGAPKPPTPPAPGAAGSRVASAPAAKAPASAASTPPPPTAARRPVPAPAVASISGLDKGLAIAAAVVSVIALGSVVYLGWFLANQPAV